MNANQIILQLKAMRTPREIVAEEEGPNASAQTIEDTAGDLYCDMAEEREKALDAMIAAARDCKTPMQMRADAIEAVIGKLAAEARSESSFADQARSKADKARHEARADAFRTAAEICRSMLDPSI